MNQATILARLEVLIAQRRMGDPATSYVAKLHAQGIAKIAQKVGEEATEVVIEALTGTPEELICEAADLVFHLLLLLGAKGVTMADVLSELERREGTSGISEKASRGA